MLTDGRRTDGRTTDGRTTDAGVTGILIAHLGAFGSGELKKNVRGFFWQSDLDPTPWRKFLDPRMYGATINGSDQPAHTRSLIRAFASHLNILWVLATDWTSFGGSKLIWTLHRLVCVYHVKMPYCWTSPPGSYMRFWYMYFLNSHPQLSSGSTCLNWAFVGCLSNKYQKLIMLTL